VFCVPIALLAFFLWRYKKLRLWQALIAVTCLGGVAATYWFPHCLPTDKLNALRWEMTSADIIGVLGPPVSTRDYPDGYHRISYATPFRHCSLDVYFNSSGRITRMFHDH
jgi:hypothetical protein